MAKLGAAVAGASLSQYPPAGAYVFIIRKFEYGDNESGSGNYEGVFEIAESEERPELVGRRLFLNINVVKKDGEPNKYGGADVRKIVAAVHGIDASADPEYDTDDLIDMRFFAVLSVSEKDGQENARLSKHAAA